ncbi:Hypothetical protein PBC10988_1150 [Planctomycetales bacterium 10988]|nr:Hypothetical protein PBC10988_1150 [Planctomycetales bacterium 10988]
MFSQQVFPGRQKSIILFYYVLFAVGLILPQVGYSQSYKIEFKSLQNHFKSLHQDVELDFEKAAERADQALQEGQEADAMIRLKVAKANEIDKLRKVASESGSVSRKFYQAAIANLNNPKQANEELVCTALYRLTIYAYKAKDFREAQVLGEYLSREFPEHPYSIQSARATMYAYFQVFNQVQDDEKKEVAPMMASFIEYIGTRWSDTDLGKEAWTRLADVALVLGDRQQARDIAQKLPKDSLRRAEILTKLALADYADFIKAQRDAGENADPASSQAQRTQLKESLSEAAIAFRRLAAQPTYTLVSAELALAQIYNQEGQFDFAERLIETPQKGLLPLARANHPAIKGPTNRTLQQEIYKVSMEMYLGTEQYEKAKEMLELLAGENQTPEAMIAMQLSLAKQMSDKLEELRDQGATPDSMKGTLNGLTALLSQIAEQGKDLKFGSLSWIGTTSQRIAKERDADGVLLEEGTAKAYQLAATIYETILSKTEADPNFTTERYLAGIQIRLAQTYQRLGKFEEALSPLILVLEAYPQNLEAQQTGAEIYQDWARRLQSDNEIRVAIQRYEQAVEGSSPTSKGLETSGEKLIWGWSTLTSRARTNSKFQEVFSEARYQLLYCQYRIALLREQPENVQKIADTIENLYRREPTLGGEVWLQRYDRLYQTVRKSLRLDPQPLAAINQ